MKTVVITGSARGLGYEMAKYFRHHNFNVVISDILKEDIDKARKELLKERGKGNVFSLVCDITKKEDIDALIEETLKKYKVIDFWINNAGVNQPNKMIWELTEDEINKMINIDLLGTMIATKKIMEVMIKQNSGSIYTVEGSGSNDAIIPGLSVYGTAKRGLTYFMDSLAKEAETNKYDIIVGKLSPGIMITDFVTNAFRNKKINLTYKEKKVYNILGDYPDTVAKFLVNKMINNTNNNVRISWLTKRKAALRFMMSPLKKRDYFKEK